MLTRCVNMDWTRRRSAAALLPSRPDVRQSEVLHSQLFRFLLVGGLRALAAGAHDPELVLDAFLLRSLSVAGYAPSFDGCAQCGVAGPHGAFAVAGESFGNRRVLACPISFQQNDIFGFEG